jgi:hypothetical protein
VAEAWAAAEAQTVAPCLHLKIFGRSFIWRNELDGQMGEYADALTV